MTTAKWYFLAAISAFSWVLTYSGIDTEVFAIFTVLLAIDYLTGIAKAYRTGETISSAKAKYGVISKFTLILIPLVVGLCAKAIGADAKVLFVWGMNLLILSETYSIISNVYMINKGKELPEWDVIAVLGRRIRTVLTDEYGGPSNKDKVQE